MRTITLEEHFVTENFLKATGADDGAGFSPVQQLRPRLLDLGAQRIAAMDEAHIDVQVLSLASMGFDDLDANTATALARDVNDELAAAVKAHPDRFAGFAQLALKDPTSAAKELERCVQTLGFKGALLDGTTGGKFLDQPEFLPVFEAAQSLDVPIYLHPAPPPKPVMDAYFSGLPEGLGHMLSIAGWGWHAETGLHTLRLIGSGLFERLPKLQVIIGHMGEGIPYALARSSKAIGSVLKLPQSVADYFRQNIHVTTSGYFTEPPLQCALAVVGIDRMMFSIDYPFSPTTIGRQYLSSLQLSGEDTEKFSYRNAEKLLKL
jgi:predicted TIM-barrel fold metal-dependent hydrolase